MDRTRNPDSMTADQRRDEVAAILARGLVRAVRMKRGAVTGAVNAPQNEGGTCLELSAASRLSVAPRIAG